MFALEIIIVSSIIKISKNKKHNKNLRKVLVWSIEHARYKHINGHRMSNYCTLVVQILHIAYMDVKSLHIGAAARNYGDSLQ